MLMLVHENYDEMLRLAALQRANVLDTPRSVEFDEIALAAKVLFGARAGLISFVDADRQWFKAAAGVEIQQAPREGSFCSVCLEHRNLLWVEDAREDPRFADNPFVQGEPGLRFYAGAPIRDRDGWLLGTVCVVDVTPRAFDEPMSMALKGLAEVAASRVAWLAEGADLSNAV